VNLLFRSPTAIQECIKLRLSIWLRHRCKRHRGANILFRCKRYAQRKSRKSLGDHVESE
jgi:hypothetical protein